MSAAVSPKANGHTALALDQLVATNKRRMALSIRVYSLIRSLDCAAVTRAAATRAADTFCMWANVTAGGHWRKLR